MFQVIKRLRYFTERRSLKLANTLVRHFGHILLLSKRAWTLANGHLYEASRIVGINILDSRRSVDTV